MRCLTLARLLKSKQAECRFICRDLPGNLVDAIRQDGFDVTVLPAPGSQQAATTSGLAHAAWLGVEWDADATQAQAALQANPCDWLVVDHYALDWRWEQAMRPHCRHIAVIDDLADRRHDCDILLDQNLGRQDDHYNGLVPGSCTVLTGPHYALLRPEFAALRQQSLERRSTAGPNHILISMGGVDQMNVTGAILTALARVAFRTAPHVTVVMGQHAPWLQAVRDLARTMPWPVDVLTNISDMASRMAGSDLSIGAAGGTSWERCALGLPTVLLILADNQRPSAKALHDAGAAITIDDVQALDSTLPVILKTLSAPGKLAEMSHFAQQITDGLGTTRMYSYMKGLYDRK